MLSFIEYLPNELSEICFIKGNEKIDHYTCNSLLIKDVLIDTGISSKYLNTIVDKFQIKKVIFTHWHEDHIAGSDLLDNCIFMCHPNDKSVIEDIYKIYHLYGYNESPPDDLINYLNKYDLKNTNITETIENNDVIKIGEKIVLKVIHTPGHSSGHCCFYEETLKFAFLSDMAMPGSGPWYGGMDSSLIEYENSIKKIMNLDINIAAFSHYGIIKETKIINDIINEQKSIIQERDEQILSNISEKSPITSNDLWKKNLIYEGTADYEQPLILSEKIMIEKHFEKFLKNGLIEPKRNGFILA